MPRLQLTIGAVLLLMACGQVKPPPVGDDAGTDFGPLEIETLALIPFVVGVEGDQTLEATGGTSPYVWSLRDPGPELGWLRIDPATGRLSGTPDAVLETTLTVVVTDSAQLSKEKQFDLRAQTCEPGTSHSCYAPEGSICMAGTRVCSDVGELGPCIGEPSTRPDKCGVSGESCGACDPNISRCEGGECRCGGADPCPAGTSCCGTDDVACVDLGSDVDNCGACGKACDPETRMNVTAGCSGSACNFACNSGFRNCNETGKSTDSGLFDLDGCEIDITTTANCGDCRINCLAGPNVTSAECLSNGVQDHQRYCKLACAPGFIDCDGKPDNGCEKEVNSDTSCGTCAGTMNCRAEYDSKPNVTIGICAPETHTCDVACETGWDDCDGDPANGCETPLNTDSNCLSCGRSCGTDSCFVNDEFQGCATKCGTTYCTREVGCHDSLPNKCGSL